MNNIRVKVGISSIYVYILDDLGKTIDYQFFPIPKTKEGKQLKRELIKTKCNWMKFEKLREFFNLGEISV